MYTAFYGLREKPFSLTPDPRYLFLASSHREALAHLLYGIDQGEGFIAVTGEVGTGKTTLCRTLLERLGSDTDVAFVFNPTLTGEELLRAISVELGSAHGGPFASPAERPAQRVPARPEARGAPGAADHRRGAEPRSRSTLEEIRLLSNLETSTSKLIQILLFGQPELDAKLESKRAAPAAPAHQRALAPRHALGIARNAGVCSDTGCAWPTGGDCDLFSDRALREVHRRARGVPRLVNLLCDRSLLAGYAANEKDIGTDLVGRAAREILGARRKRLVKRRLWRRGVAAGLMLAALAAGAYGWGTWSPPAEGETSVSAGPAAFGAVPAGPVDPSVSEEAG